MSKVVTVVQTFEEYFDYSDYPEGEKRTRLEFSELRQPTEDERAVANVETRGNYVYYRVTRRL